MDQSLEFIWEKFADRLKKFILSKTHNENIADDILQEVFIKIHAKIDSLKDETKLQSWIFQITRNLITDYFREQKKKENSSDQMPDENSEYESENVMAEALEDMAKMMAELPTDYCEALCQTELGGMSQKEYAHKKGISYSGAKSRVQRARSMLKDMLMQCCHYEFDKYGTVINISPIHCCCCS